MSVLLFPHCSSAQHPHSPSRTYNNAETKQVLSTWCLCYTEVSASLEHIYRVPITMGTSCSQSSPPSLLSTSISWSLVLGQWLLLIHVWCLVASSALVSSALFQPIMAGVNAGVPTALGPVSAVFHSILFQGLSLPTNTCWRTEYPNWLMTQHRARTSLSSLLAVNLSSRLLWPVPSDWL